MIYRNNNQIQGIDITLIRRKQFPSNYFNELLQVNAILCLILIYERK